MEVRAFPSLGKAKVKLYAVEFFLKGLRNKRTCLAILDKAPGSVVVCLPRPMEGNGVTLIFRSLQNCQFHHRRLESLEHFNVLYIYIYI